APVESLMPLRLARYGVPLAQTAPEGLAAAGIPTPAEVAVKASPAQHGRPTASLSVLPALMTPGPEETDETAPTPDSRTPAGQPVPASQVSMSATDAGRFAGPYEDFLTQFQVEPTPFQWAVWLRDHYGISTGTGAPLSEDQLAPILKALQQRNATRPAQRADDQQAPAADQSWEDYFYSAWRSFQQDHGFRPTADVLAAYVYERDMVTNESGRPVSGDDLVGFFATFHERDADEPASDLGPEPGDAEVVQTSTQIGDRPEDGQDIADGPGVLTTVDRYYLAWAAFQAGNRSSSSTSSREAEELSAYLAERGMRGRGDKPVNPATLRRYLLPFRVYHVWAAHRSDTDQPSLASVAQECAVRGITAQYKRPITEDYLAAEVEGFERRWQALAGHPKDSLDISVS
ncbi:hypothetical protein AB0D30_41135, partial [Streptomyces sp. NPDC048409]